jgi:hypothetical protein
MGLSNESAYSNHLVRISWFQVSLLLCGVLSWMILSLRAGFVFMVTGVVSVLFWHLHRWLIVRVLTPHIRWRLVFGFLIIVKLALIAMILRGIINYFPTEVVPFVTGIMLFSAPILIEAIYLIFRSGFDVNC